MESDNPDEIPTDIDDVLTSLSSAGLVYYAKCDETKEEKRTDNIATHGSSISSHPVVIKVTVEKTKYLRYEIKEMSPYAMAKITDDVCEILSDNTNANISYPVKYGIGGIPIFEIETPSAQEKHIVELITGLLRKRNICYEHIPTDKEMGAITIQCN